MTAEEVSAWCKEYNIASFMETSAKHAVNITEAFTEAVRQWRILDRKAAIDLREDGDTINLMQRPITIGASGGRQGGCCGGSGGSNSAKASDFNTRENL